MVAVLGFSKHQVTGAVQAMYGAVAASPAGDFHFPVGRKAAVSFGYSEAEIDSLPADTVASFAGVGYPFRAGVIMPGDIVLDIGAGSGTDSLIAAELAGEAGKVYALDITPAMVAKLRHTVEEAGIDNVEVIEADAEHIPLPDGSVDVVTSNGALNLVPDKRKAFAEIFRVLRPDGRVQLADIVITRPVPLGGRSDPKLWAECVVGASIDEDYLELFRHAGFTHFEVLNEHDYFALSPSADTRRIAATLGARAIEVTMHRPAEAAASPWTAAVARRLDPKRLARRIGERGLWGAVAAVAALAACYGTMALAAILSLISLGLVLDEAVWAVTITGAALLAVVATGFNLPRHRNPLPLALAGLAATVIVLVMFAAYHPVVEAAGFVALISAVGLDLYLIYRAACVSGDTGRGMRAAGTRVAHRAEN